MKVNPGTEGKDKLEKEKAMAKERERQYRLLVLSLLFQIIYKQFHQYQKGSNLSSNELIFINSFPV